MEPNSPLKRFPPTAQSVGGRHLTYRASAAPIYIPPGAFILFQYSNKDSQNFRPKVCTGQVIVSQDTWQCHSRCANQSLLYYFLFLLYQREVTQCFYQNKF